MTTSAATPSGPSSSQAASLVGQVLSDRYRIEALLGEGGMGAVYLAEHVLMHKRLAVKVLHQEMTRMPEVVARFEREAMAAAHIEHPNVAAATDFGKLADGSFFLVLEYIEGTSLRDVVCDGPLEPSRVLHIVHQIAMALSRAHGLGIVHRDLKPENVMLVLRDGDSNFVKVLDFGIAKVPVGELVRGEMASTAGQTLTQLGMVYGTPEYMAPEQALGQQVDARADLYALGVMMFEMLTGVRPFEAESKVALLGMKVTRDPPSMGSKNRDVEVPQAVEALTMRLLEKEASKRFQDAREVIEAIERVRIGEAKTEPPPSVGQPPSAVTVSTPRRGSSPRGSFASLATVEQGARVLPRLVVRLSSAAQIALSSARSLGERLPAVVHSVRQLPSRVQRMPAKVLALVGGLAIVVFAVVLLLSLRRNRDRVAAAADGGTGQNAADSILSVFSAPTTAAPEAIASAAASGTPALQVLATKFDKDPAVWRALLKAYTEQEEHVAAMEAIAKLLGFGENALDDDEARSAIVAAMQGDKESLDAALSLLEGPLGTKGADWLYDWVNDTSPSMRQLRASGRLKKSLDTAIKASHASAGLQVAIDLKNAKSCDAKKKILPRAKEHGDLRALALLRPLVDARGCGFLGLGDCWPCMHRDMLLQQTIAAIEARK